MRNEKKWIALDMDSQTKTICWGCNVEITLENNSDEHIIPFSIGGGLSSKNLLCGGCNNSFGGGLDGILSGQMGYLADLFYLRTRKRRKMYKAFDDKGNSVWMIGPGEMAPSLDIYVDHLKKTIPIVGPTKDEIFKNAEIKLNQIFKDNSDKVAEMMSSIEIIEAGPINIIHSNARDPNDLRNSIVGELPFYRAIGKIAVNFAAYSGVGTERLGEIINYVLSESESEFKRIDKPFCRNYYPTYYVPYYPLGDEVSHVISLKGSRRDGLLLCYVELFNAFCFLIILNDNYDGADINLSHVRTLHPKKSSVIVQHNYLHKPLGFYRHNFIYSGLTSSDSEREVRYKRMYSIAHSRLKSTTPTKLTHPIPKPDQEAIQ